MEAGITKHQLRAFTGKDYIPIFHDKLVINYADVDPPNDVKSMLSACPNLGIPLNL